MRHFITFIGSIIAAIICAGTGGYVLWQFHTTTGLATGVMLVLLGVCIALPIQLKEGVSVLKSNAIIIIPVVVDALKGGSRKTDPPASDNSHEST
jgi:hypothetical protein